MGALGDEVQRFTLKVTSLFPEMLKKGEKVTQELQTNAKVERSRF